MKSVSNTISKKHWIVIAVLVAVGVVGGAAILGTERAKPAAAHGHEAGHGDEEHHGAAEGDEHAHADEHGDEEHHAQGAANGPHGGQLMTDGNFGLEIQLAEEGGKAFFKVWLYDKDKPLPPNAAKVAITLTRPGGEQQRIALAPGKDGLTSTQPVAEPHVFEATIEAQTAKEPFLFAYSQQEGKVALSDAQIKSAGITVDTASPARIQASLQLPGEIRFDEDRTAHVVPRVGGIVESVAASLGQRVRRGEVLAVISSAAVSEQRSELRTAQKRLALAKTTHERERKLWEEKISPQQDVLQAEQALREAEIAVANASQKLRAIGAGAGNGAALNRFELRSPLDGTVVEKHIALGESVKEDASVFTISDLSTVWAEIDIAAKDLNQVRVGEKVTIRSSAFAETAGGTVSYVGSLLGEQTRTAKARITLPNPNLAWRPGLFVTVELVTSETDAPVTVASDAIQQLDDQPAVYVKVPGGFVPQPVQTGRSDGKRVEIVQGLKPGTGYAAAGSFVVKAEAGKASAEHTH
jgi:cobalt-zinc-cadmium efflux system membrane fusion protein